MKENHANIADREMNASAKEKHTSKRDLITIPGSFASVAGQGEGRRWWWGPGPCSFLQMCLGRYFATLGPSAGLQMHSA
jgi:hypothetical protein